MKILPTKNARKVDLKWVCLSSLFNGCLYIMLWWNVRLKSMKLKKRHQETFRWTDINQYYRCRFVHFLPRLLFLYKCYIKLFTNMYWYLLLYVCELTADGSICIASVNTGDSIWGTALEVKLLVKLLGSFILCSISCIKKENRLELDERELVQLTCTLCCVTTIKLIKDRKHLLLFPQFIKYKTFELLWNSRI